MVPRVSRSEYQILRGRLFVGSIFDWWCVTPPPHAQHGKKNLTPSTTLWDSEKLPLTVSDSPRYPVRIERGFDPGIGKLWQRKAGARCDSNL